ncbi:MAG: dihydroorotate dehydrogenase electron transfer subunit [Syntrophaceae bacterium]|nr:dihydroorotate dehydrogenase electron transfer subunit [Syntrophaceae bacterium]
MAKNIYIGEIFKNEEIAQDCFLMSVALHSTFAEPQPGQFVMLRISGISEPFLARPFSIYSFQRETDFCRIDLLYQVVGKGTQILAGLIKGSQVEILGPLGNGFEISQSARNLVLIAGGMGAAPLSFLAEYLDNKVCSGSSKIYFYLGARNSETLIGMDKINNLTCTAVICTDDGSLGEKGLVTQILAQDLKKYAPDQTMIYACGPKPMLKELAKILQGTKFKCQVSLEERMACGVGACLGCAVEVKGKKGMAAYKRVCADGPVFYIDEIAWKKI